MADKSLPSAANAESIEEALRRISKKPGVRAWLMLDRSTGAVLRTNGHVASVRPARSLLQNPNPNTTGGGENNNNGSGGENTSGGGTGTAAPDVPSTPSATTTAFPTATGPGTVAVTTTPEGGAAPGVNPETQAATELAALVWGFLGTAGGLVEEMDSEDELKLLRLRTKKQEFVIVPEPKYLMVVIHDTPPA